MLICDVLVKDKAKAASSVCISGYPLSGYPDLSVNFMAAKIRIS